MKYCSKCGAPNDDSANFCISCGNPLTGSVSSGDAGYGSGSGTGYGGTGYGSGNGTGYDGSARTSSRSSGSGVKILLIVLGTVLVFAIVACVLIFALSPRLTLLRAGKASLKLLTEAIEDNTDQDISSTPPLRALAKGEFSGALEFGEEDEYSLLADFSYSKKENLLSGSATLTIDDLGLPIAADYSLEDSVLKMYIPALGDNVYGMDLSADDSPLSDFGSSNVRDLLTDIAAGNLTAIARSVEVEKLGNRTIVTDDGKLKCRVYQISWSEDSDEKFEKLMKKSGHWSDLTESFIDYITSCDIRINCYVSGGKLLCIDYINDGETMYTILLNGADNPWDSLLIQDLDYETTACIESVRRGSTLYISFTDDGEECLCLEYNTGSGRWTAQQYGYDSGIGGRFLSDKDEFVLEFSEEYYRSLGLTITEQESDPEAISGSYTDMQSVDWEDLIYSILFSGYF